MPAAPRFKEALEVLAGYHVDLVVVGGVAAVINGAPIATFDLDVVHARSEDNLHRLAAATRTSSRTQSRSVLDLQRCQCSAFLP